MALLTIAQPAFAAPVTSVIGLPVGWSKSDVTLSMTTDLSWDPTTEVFYALGPVSPPQGSSMTPPEADFWNPGHGWIIYSAPNEGIVGTPFTITDEGITRMFFWSYRYC
jgi:hypothetical protein